MKKRTCAAMLVGAGILLNMAGVCFAQEVIFAGEKCPLTVISDLQAEADEAVAVEVSLDSMEVLGMVNQTYLSVLYDNGKTGYVSLEEISEKIPSLQLGELESVTDWADFGRGSGGDRAMQVQQILFDLKLLDGGVDGAYGSGTEASVREFQKQTGLEETGVVDAATWFLLMRETELFPQESEPVTVTYPPVYTIEEKFAAICNQMEDPSILESFLDPEWKFTYDVFEGEGIINYTKDGLSLGSIEIGDRDIDRIRMEAALQVQVQRGEEGEVTITPTLTVTANGAGRPYIQGATLKRGTAVYDLACIWSEGGLDGVESTETAWLEVPAEVYGFLADKTQPSELSLRIRGLHRYYDMDLSGQLRQMTAFVGAYSDEAKEEDSENPDILHENGEDQTEEVMPEEIEEVLTDLDDIAEIVDEADILPEDTVEEFPDEEQTEIDTAEEEQAEEAVEEETE